VSKRAWLLLSAGVVTFLLLLTMFDLAFLTRQIARSSERDAAAMRAAVKRVRTDLVAMQSSVDRIMASGEKRGLNEFKRASEHFPKDLRTINDAAARMDPQTQTASKNVVDTAQLLSHTASTFSRAGGAVNAHVAREIARQQREDIARFDAANNQLTAAMSGDSGLAAVRAVALAACAVFAVVLVVLLILAGRSRRPTGLVDATR
jgi:CHASE3 domain sensor protein